MPWAGSGDVVGVGLGDGLPDGEGDGDGEADGVGDGLGVGDGVGDGPGEPIPNARARLNVIENCVPKPLLF